jgi:glutaminase
MLQKNIHTLLEDIYKKCRDLKDGHLPAYIPELTKADPNLFAISVITLDGQCYSIGDADKEFTIQSIVKPFMHGMALEKLGRKRVLSKIGVEPTGDPYNAIKLQPVSNRPFNPMVNAGAIALANIIPGADHAERIVNIKQTLEIFAGRELNFDVGVYTSEKAMGNHNRAMAYLMLNFGILQETPEEILETYFQACSFLVNTKDAAMMAATLANKGKNPFTGQQALSEKCIKDVTCVMLMCGMYDFAGEWAYTVGIPAKSGISGGIMGAVPGRMGIAVFSPLLDKRGNSIRGIRVFQELSKALDLSIF